MYTRRFIIDKKVDISLIPQKILEYSGLKDNIKYSLMNKNTEDEYLILLFNNETLDFRIHQKAMSSSNEIVLEMQYWGSFKALDESNKNLYLYVVEVFKRIFFEMGFKRMLKFGRVDHLFRIKIKYKGWANQNWQGENWFNKQSRWYWKKNLIIDG